MMDTDGFRVLPAFLQVRCDEGHDLMTWRSGDPNELVDEYLDHYRLYHWEHGTDINPVAEAEMRVATCAIWEGYCGGPGVEWVSR